jgi:hypothetical protein
MWIHLTGQIGKPAPVTNPAHLFGIISTEDCNGRVLRIVNEATGHYIDEVTQKDPVSNKNCSYEVSMRLDWTYDLSFWVGNAGVTSNPADRDRELLCDAAHCSSPSGFEGAFKDAILLNLGQYFRKGITPCGTDFVHQYQFDHTFERVSPEQWDVQYFQKNLQNFNSTPTTNR